MELALRKKFVLICVTAVFCVLLVIAVVINLLNYHQIEQNVQNNITLIAENDGALLLPDPMDQTQQMPFFASPSTSMNTLFFVVKLDETGTLLSVDTSNFQQMNDETASEIGLNVYQSEGSSGSYEGFKYSTFTRDYGTLLVFVDYSSELMLTRSFLITSIGICLIALVAVFVLVLLFSKRAVAPILQSYEKQKQFIADMSHEIKTPLAIIKANTEVIELENGTTQWSESIHTQVVKLSRLVNSLLSLTRLDLQKDARIRYEFDLSQAVLETAEPFEVLADQVRLDVTAGIHYVGDEHALRQLISILIENAIKYRENDSEILLSLSANKNKLCLVVANQAHDVAPGKHLEWFERFYRGEHSRNSQTGGFGIGLAMAKSIVDKHAGKITAQCKAGNRIEIRVEL